MLWYSFYIKMMKRRTLQVCSFNESIKKAMFICLGEIELFKSGRGGGRFLPPPSYLLATRLVKIHGEINVKLAFHEIL